MAAGGSINYNLPVITDPENDTIIVTLLAPCTTFASISGTVITIAPPITASGTL